MTRKQEHASAEPRAPVGSAWVARACLASSVVCDLFAVAVLLFGTSLPFWTAIATVAASHGLAMLLAWSSDSHRPSRRWLNLAAVAAIPCLGAAVAATALATRGRGTSALAHRPTLRSVPALAEEEIQRLESGLSPYDALLRGDSEQRLATLSALSQRSDAEAIALLRWTAEDRDPDRALSAALVLDHLGEQAERALVRSAPEEDERVFG